MSGARFLDDLARMLAEPMPRRRALRLLGTSLAAVAVPGVVPRTARAARGSRSATCGQDKRTCQKGAEAQFEKYCCPSPSWQFFCGGQTNGYKCVNQCRGPVNFPCTALIEDREAGRNGVCCDRRIHSGCDPARRDPDGKVIRTSGGGSVPQCIPCAGKMCENKSLPLRDPSRWTCCMSPSTCERGICRCKNGQYSTQCLTVGTRAVFGSEIDGSLGGRKCCPKDARYCCGNTCCKTFGCCGTKCCPTTSRCALSGGRKVCCPVKRITVVGDNFGCCPVGTVHVPWSGGCCPEASLDCCGTDRDKPLACGEKLCVRGKCVNS